MDERSLRECPNFLNVILARRYVMQHLIGQGGWSSVFMAFDRTLHRDVAIKVLHTSLSPDEHNRRRFEREARTISTLSHPNIVSVFDFGIMPSGQPYLVLEYLQGQSLEEIIKQRAPLAETTVADVAVQVARALSCAHKQGVIHRDIKPSNIFVLNDTTSGDGRTVIKLMDFGLAKCLKETDDPARLTASGVTLGTPSYMSPEQCQGIAVDQRSDIYSLGCTIYEMLCGAPPFEGNALDCMHAHLLEEPKELSARGADVKVSAPMKRIVSAAMAKSRERRIASADELAEAMVELQNQNHPGIISTSSLRHAKSATSVAFGKIWLVVGALLLIACVYVSAPVWLKAIGVRSVEIDVNDLAPSAMDEVVSEMAKTGKLQSSREPPPATTSSPKLETDSNRH